LPSTSKTVWGFFGISPRVSLWIILRHHFLISDFGFRISDFHLQSLGRKGIRTRELIPNS
jgi:hypothetical protein